MSSSATLVTGSPLFALFDSVFAQMFQENHPYGENTLSSKNLVASTHVKREKALRERKAFIGAAPRMECAYISKGVILKTLSGF